MELMKAITKTTLVVFLVIGSCSQVMVTTTRPYEAYPGDVVPLLTSMICERRPHLKSCTELNETLQNGLSSPSVDIVKDNTSIALVQSYIAETEEENLKLKKQELDQELKILQLEEEKRLLENKVQALEVEFLPTHDKYPWLPRREVNLAKKSSPDKNYQPTANLLRPVDCADYLIVGAYKSGVYDIYPFKCRCSEPVKVWCDMETDGGGWTVIVNRRNYSQPLNFSRSWNEYKQGFGNVSEEHWIGNEILHVMTTTRAYTVRLDVEQSDGGNRWAEWPKFSVESEEHKYKLVVPHFNEYSTTENCLVQHNGKPFSTFDFDNDANGRNCAEMKQGGFWYNNCATLDPTKKFGEDGILRTSCTYNLSGRSMQITGHALQLKIRPRICGELVKAVHFNTHTCEGHNGQ